MIFFNEHKKRTEEIKQSDAFQVKKCIKLCLNRSQIFKQSVQEKMERFEMLHTQLIN